MEKSSINRWVLTFGSGLVLVFMLVLCVYSGPLLDSDHTPDVRPFNDTAYVMPNGRLKEGVVSGRYHSLRNQGGDNAYPHTGVDYRLLLGTDILATAAGKVKYAGDTRTGYGWLIVIDHGGGVETWYAHVSKQWVVEGKDVTKGQLIAAVGDTGRASGPHLHYEIRVNGKTVDPAKYIFRKEKA